MCKRLSVFGTLLLPVVVLCSCASPRVEVNQTQPVATPAVAVPTPAPTLESIPAPTPTLQPTPIAPASAVRAPQRAARTRRPRPAQACNAMNGGAAIQVCDAVKASDTAATEAIPVSAEVMPAETPDPTPACPGVVSCSAAGSGSAPAPVRRSGGKFWLLVAVLLTLAAVVVIVVRRSSRSTRQAAEVMLPRPADLPRPAEREASRPQAVQPAEPRPEIRPEPIASAAEPQLEKKPPARVVKIVEVDSEEKTIRHRTVRVKVAGKAGAKAAKPARKKAALKTTRPAVKTVRVKKTTHSNHHEPKQAKG